MDRLFRSMALVAATLVLAGCSATFEASSPNIEQSSLKPAPTPPAAIVEPEDTYRSGTPAKTLSNVCETPTEGNWSDFVSVTLSADEAHVFATFRFEQPYANPEGQPYAIDMGTAPRLLLGGSIEAIAYITNDDPLKYVVRTHWGGPVIEGATLERDGAELRLTLPRPEYLSASDTPRTWYAEAAGFQCPGMSGIHSEYLFTDVFTR